jgi:transposase
MRIELVIEAEDLPEHVTRQNSDRRRNIRRVDVVAAKFRVIVTRRPKCAFKNEDGVILDSAPTHIIEAAVPTEALLVQIAVSKYTDVLPLYRQEAIYARDKAELDRRLMAQWRGKLGFELKSSPFIS